MVVAIVFMIFSNTLSKVHAQEYVLPYPGFMPGSSFYKISQAVDKVQQLWSFGNFAQFSYHLGLADKKLVEAKTLFEYKQYLLANYALCQSDHYFGQAIIFLRAAEGEKKNISGKRKILQDAAKKHIEVLNLLGSQVPETLVWQPEKEEPISLSLQNSINTSIDLRGQEL